MVVWNFGCKEDYVFHPCSIFFLFKNDHPCRPLHCLSGSFSTLLIVGKFLPPGFGEEKRETKYQEDKISRDTKQNMKDQI